MNWVGGARSRLNRRNEKKIQQQFFEEKRKARKMGITSQFSSQCNSLNLSQDLLSFRRLSNAYSSKPLIENRPHKKARFVDLDSTKPRSQFIKIKEDSNQSFDKDLRPSALQLSEDNRNLIGKENVSIKIPISSKKYILEEREDLDKEEEGENSNKENNIFLSESVIEVPDTIYKNDVHLEIDTIRIDEVNAVSKQKEEETPQWSRHIVHRSTSVSQFVSSSQEQASVENLTRSKASKDFFNLFD